uniref:Transmembrane protein n=1 Tax=Caenorhabditis japonica TaxID=281687 RepID=A0A8R1ILQ2_CAEJA
MRTTLLVTSLAPCPSSFRPSVRIPSAAHVPSPLSGWFGLHLRSLPVVHSSRFAVHNPLTISCFLSLAAVLCLSMFMCPLSVRDSTEKGEKKRMLL